MLRRAVYTTRDTEATQQYAVRMRNLRNKIIHIISYDCFLITFIWQIQYKYLFHETRSTSRNMCVGSVAINLQRCKFKDDSISF
jgi:hypothetical protein